MGCVPAGAEFRFNVPLWPRAVASHPADRATACSRVLKPLDCRPTMHLEPPNGGDRPFPSRRVGPPQCHEDDTTMFPSLDV